MKVTIKRAGLKLINKVKQVEIHIIRKYTTMSLITLSSIVYIAISLGFYSLVPVLLNYPPGTVATKPSGISYGMQYIIIILFAIILSNLFLYSYVRKIYKLYHYVQENPGKEINQSWELRNYCMNVPYKFYILQVSSPLIIITFLYTILRAPLAVSLNIFLLVFIFITLVANIFFIFSRRIFKRLLIDVNNNECNSKIRFKISQKITMHILPMIVVAIIFTSMIGYSRIIKEKGDLLFSQYKSKLSTQFVNKRVTGFEEIFQELSSIDISEKEYSFFVISPDNVVRTSNNSKLSNFFVFYINKLSFSYDGRASEATGDFQGVAIKIPDENGDWIAGIRYKVTADNTMLFYIISFIVLLVLNLIILAYYSKDFAEDISLVANSLMEIAESKDVDLNKKIPVTSNDEIGDLVMAFNKIQEKQKEYIKKLNDNQEIMMQQDRLASLGQMIGGIAHNMKTPIMSISGGFEALKDLIKEYDESIGEDSVTIEDHHEIAAEMREWIEKMKPYLSYMSDIISAVKGQAVKLNESSQHTFTIRELADRIKILMKYELKRYECSMDVDIQIEPEAELRGEVNNLVQVLNNLISNAIDAYDGKGGKIEFGIYRKGLIIEFIVKDYGKGISNEVKNRLFKEMLTTKGKKGTGLGLYMSYSAIRAKFGGNIWFESEEGKGTTFYVSIPFL